MSHSLPLESGGISMRARVAMPTLLSSAMHRYTGAALASPAMHLCHGQAGQAGSRHFSLVSTPFEHPFLQLLPLASDYKLDVSIRSGSERNAVMVTLICVLLSIAVLSFMSFVARAEGRLLRVHTDAQAGSSYR
ncbi:hypothetical protein E5Q_01781 [Mixia osmundae IAM 14324]|uniref:Uncharacterized protein n=1 Tax=Mixia osmundae (strain CBS 9802 / IAM 14324 / JCM 22182 / KY 12970) TaxID=764103 RepID=G7DX29_MIXOS|nr:hypothetical protein E5Q_01781 [Mixia osmundae IAM 14324]